MKSKFIPKILLMYKSSSYQHYFLRHARRRGCVQWNSRALHRFRRTHVVHYQTLAFIEKTLRDQHVSYRKIQRGRNIDLSGYDLIITVGGDGTILEAARYIGKNQILLGVNSDPLWSVGRFCSATRETFPLIFNSILRDKFKLEKISRLSLSLEKQKKRTYVLNDVLVCHENPAAMSRYCLAIDGRKEEQRSSGIWISTAAGSTGAIASAGGRNLPFLSTKYQYLVRELYYGGWAKHGLTGGVLNKTQKVTITSFMNDGMLSIDGSHYRLSFPFGEKVTLRSCNQPLLLVKKPTIK